MDATHSRFSRSQSPSQSQSIAQLCDSEHENFTRLGRLAPKWIEDLLAGPLKDDAPNVLDVGCASQATQTVASNGAQPRLGMVKGRHELLVTGVQCDTQPYGTDNDGFDQVLSCTCRHCRYHFVLYIQSRGGELCGPNNFKDVFHHLVYLGEHPNCQDVVNKKYYPIIGGLVYNCSAMACSYSLRLEVSEPRLPPQYIDILQDDIRILARRDKAVKEDPERFKDLRDMAPNPLMYLWIYLRDIVDPKPGQQDAERKVDKRNKKFYIQFGNDTDTIALFQFLEFEEIVNGEAEAWKVPNPDMHKPTLIGSRLAFFQDLKSEVETLRAQSEREREDVKPHLAIDHLKLALGIEGAIAETKANPQNYDSRDFDVLGITPTLHESILWYAFTCQIQTCPSSQEDLFQALCRLSQGRSNEDLDVRLASYESVRDAPRPLTEDDEIRRATEMSLQEAQTHTNQALASAYDYFGLAMGPRVSEDIVIGKYLAFCESSPKQKPSHLDKLIKIARETKSDRLLSFARECLNYEGALQYLGFAHDTTSDYIDNLAAYMAKEKDKDAFFVAAAVRVIGEVRQDAALQSTATDIMASKTGDLDPDTSSHMDIDTSSPQDQNNPALPIGLQNIRNTCYLNSILQYFFTVKPVRDLVLEREQYYLEITPENVAQRRIDPGAKSVTVGEAFAGQRLVAELSTLFTALQESSVSRVKPRQQLALAALKNAERLEKDGEVQLAKIVAAPETTSSRRDLPPPPLPARPSPAPPMLPRPESRGPHVTVNAISDPDRTESSSTVSSQTLVNQAEDIADLDQVDALSQSVGDKAEGWKSELTAEDIDMEDLPGLVDDTEHVEGTSAADEPLRVGFTAETPAVYDYSVEEKIAKALDDSSVTGTDQQDVEEVMGNIIGHLRAAIKATGEDLDTGIQTDPITEVFFPKVVTYNKMRSANEWNSKINQSRWITAYPSPTETISLMDALDVNFGLQYINDDQQECFEAIIQLPPILHICIQRSTTGDKNMNPIIIPEVLYLDRYMDAAWDSELLARRKRSWDLRARLDVLSAPKEEPKHQATSKGSDSAQSKEVDDELLREYDLCVVDQPEESSVDETQETPLIDDEIQGILVSHGLAVPTAGDQEQQQTQGWNDAQQGPVAELEKPLERSKEALDHDLASRLAARESTESRDHEELDNLFGDLQKQKYFLHAVICHMGQTRSSGHYWVWIYDFDKQLWRKYNDDKVLEEANSASVMQELSTKGEPYYLAYVRAEDVASMVNVPERTHAEQDT